MSTQTRSHALRYSKAPITIVVFLLSSWAALAFTEVHKVNPITISLEHPRFQLNAAYPPGRKVVLTAYATASVSEVSAQRDELGVMEEEAPHDVTLTIEKERQGFSTPRTLTVRDFRIDLPIATDLTLGIEPGERGIDLYVGCGSNGRYVKRGLTGCIGSLEPAGKDNEVSVCTPLHNVAMQLTYTDSTWHSHSEAATQFSCLEVHTSKTVNISASSGFGSRGAYETDIESIGEPFQLERTQQGPVLLDTAHLDLPEAVHRFELVSGATDQNLTITWEIKPSAGKRQYSFVADSINTSLLSADGVQMLPADPAVSCPGYLHYDVQEVAGKTKEITLRLADGLAKTNLWGVVFSSTGLSNVAEVIFHDGSFVSVMRQEDAPDADLVRRRVSQLMQAYLIEKGIANEKIRRLTPEQVKNLVFGGDSRRNSSSPENLVHLFEEIETADFRQFMHKAARDDKSASETIKQVDSWLEQQAGLSEFGVPSIPPKERYPVVMGLRFPRVVAPGRYSAQFVVKGSNFKSVPISFVLQIEDPWEKWWARIFAVGVGICCAILGAFVGHRLRLGENRNARRIDENAQEKTEKTIADTSEVKPATEATEPSQPKQAS